MTYWEALAQNMWLDLLMITVSPNRQLRIKINEGDIQLFRAVPLQLHILDAFAFFSGRVCGGFLLFQGWCFLVPFIAG